MRAFVLIVCLATCSAAKGKYKDFMDRAKDPSYFSKDKSLERFKEFKEGALNMTNKNFRGDNDVNKDNIKLGFEVFRNFSKHAAKKLVPAPAGGSPSAGDEAVKTLGLMLNKDVLNDARGRLGAGERKQFDKEISLEGKKARMQIAKNLIDGVQADDKREYNTENMKLFIHRAPKANLVNKYLRVNASGVGAFKLPPNLALPSGVAEATAVVHQLREGDGHWGRQANKYHVKSSVIGMQLLKDNGEEIEIKNLADADRIQIRFPHVNSSVVGVCAWWDIENGEWSVQGCSRSANPPDDGFGAECKCNHLTEFAIVAATSNATVVAPVEEGGGWSSGDTATVAVSGVLVSGVFFAAFVKSPMTMSV